jgi:regulator of replication initiation timing
MNAIQLEFNVKDESESEVKLNLMQKQINAMEESMGKVRRKLFSQVSEMQKLYLELKMENENLKGALKELKNEKTDWSFGQEDTLFSIRKAQGA